MSRRFVSWVRPERISSPMISTAQVTRLSSPLAIRPTLAYISLLPHRTKALHGLPATARPRNPRPPLQALLRRCGPAGRDGSDRPLPEPRRNAGPEHPGPARLAVEIRRPQAQA